jgi:hypothetical protein
MSQHVWFSAGGERIQESLDAAFEWCERWSMVSEAPTIGERGDALWEQVDRNAGRARAAVLSRLELADTERLRPLQSAGCVRHFAQGPTPLGHFVWFERGDQLRFMLAPGKLCASTVSGPGVWVLWEGSRGALPAGLQAILDECLSASVVLGATELVVASPPVSAVATYSRAIPSVREVLGMRSSVDLFQLEVDAQERALWSALIGEGAVDLEQAIRFCAERLRAQGFLDFQVLRQDGRVHGAIEERLLAARRSTDLFDRPRNGFVRAIQPELDELTAEQWRDCLMGALDEGARVDRDQAVRLGFAYAQETYGINAQRLRVGGRADQALRSAINSSIRQGYLGRDGAAYLIRVSPLAAPTLRGVLAFEPPEDATPTSRPVEAAPIEPVHIEPGPVETAPAPAPTQPKPIEPTLTETVPAESVPPPEQATTEEVRSPLNRTLLDLEFPTRTLNWANRQGINTVRELVAWRPEHFKTERNVGRRTVRETRELIEAHLGYSWEDAYAAVHGQAPAPVGGVTDEDIDPATEALTAGGAAGWARVAGALTHEQRAVALVDVRLPTRMKNFVRGEGLGLLGDLFQLSYATLAERANLGRKSLNDTLDAVRDFLSERGAPAPSTFIEAWQAQLGALEPVARMIVTRRAGMHGTRETLEELGGMLGVTRERVRQIEARVVERLAERSRWRLSVEANITAAFGAGRALPLDLLAQDPWWAGIDRQELLLDYVVRRIFEDELFIVNAPSGKRYLTKFPTEAVDQHLESAKVRVAKLEYPIETSAIDEILHSEADPLDPILFAEFELVVRELLHIDVARPHLALGYGRRRDDEVLAFLSGQEEPVPVAIVEERFGRGHLPDEVLYFKRGVIGLKRHFPDFDVWMERLVPAALEVMQERPAGRQWLVPEIHDALLERGLIPDWLGHWHLASLLRLSGRVEYLGRLRVSLKDSGQEQRLQYEELLEQTLEDAGGPLDFNELVARVRVRTDISEGGASSTVLTAPFVRLDDSRIGLVERDIAGGPQAVAAAIEAVIQALNESQQGLTPHQATLLVKSLSATHATWTPQLVTSLLRSEASLRIDRSRNIGLDEWDDVRCPTRPEFIRREVQRAGGTLSLAELNARMANFYGRAPDRSSLGVLVAQLGFELLGDHVSRPGGVAPEAPLSRASINLTGIPTELREMFEELVKKPLSDVLDLRAQVRQHVEAIATEHHVNEFVDLPGAHVLARQCQMLLDRSGSLPIPDRHLVNAAVLYFISWDDLENDFDIGGLDDDKQIMNAVLSHLGILEDDDGARAS